MKKSINKFILSHVLAVLMFLIYEVRLLFMAGTNVIFFELLAFYAFDIFFVYITILWYLNLVQSFHHNFFYKVFFYLLWILLFSIMAVFLTYLLLTNRGIDLQSNSFTDDLLRAIWRRLFLFSIALGYWFARYSLKKDRDIYMQKIQLAEAKESALKQENALLRAQVNPHLMFNALNTMYGQLEEKSPDSARIAYLLAEMMTYALSDQEHTDTYTLRDEMDQVKRFLELHKLINEGEMYVRMDINMPEDLYEIIFPPLLIINLVDNIFKHGVTNDKSRAALISVHYERQYLHIITCNDIGAQLEGEQRRHGLGLANTGKRLEQYYPDSFKFNSYKRDNEYRVSLSIKVKL